jgi:hypothetical protein
LYGDVVRSGPFVGIAYAVAPVGDNLIPKLLGTYELELHDEIERMLALQPSRVINIGCAEGYYAVGLARRLPQAEIIASDLSPTAIQACAELARVNGVTDSVKTVGGLSAERLNELCGNDCLLLVDCEGCEFTILNPEMIPALLLTSIIVELHDFVIPDVTGAVLRRFEGSHEVSVIESSDRELARYPELEAFSVDDQSLALSEYRPGVMRWAVLTPR